MDGNRHAPEHLDRLVATFERDGFVNGGIVVGPEELELLRADVERFADVHIRQQPATGPVPEFRELGHDAETRHYKMDNLWRFSAAFRALAENPRLVARAAAVARSRTLRIWADGIHYKPPLHGGPVTWHQDGIYHFSYMARGNVDRILSAWIALDDADEESGCMWMVPGSHRWGHREDYLRTFIHLKDRTELGTIQPHPEVDPGEWRSPIPCPVKAGEVHFHHTFTWHASPINRSPRLRRGHTIFYMADGVEGGEDLPLVFEADAGA
jgi:ectoine hydroxylase-related dioxygenase (phytanoyl-CoA dioxygenase family)